MKFKVGDWVERTEDSLNNEHLKDYRYMRGVYRVILVQEEHSIMWVMDKDNKQNWHFAHWQLAKNHIIKQIIQDL